eukprot:CAMPEP_0197028592 /NCGR_PEP_ID=MMETSP1384-20130603/8243_1 /TAXON_ID=29189 /ORGANISM="Ammonia sp." /LENGTH=290 /DNA_ID=CAMNT_0042457613 /DNA_START=409 /DNA_END=1281 /DNA_ORIENTATION=-
MVDYRGYGNSEGVPTEKGLAYDAESILAHLLQRNDINLRKVYLFGRSLGGAVAIDLAYRCCTGKLATLDKNSVLINDRKLSVDELNHTSNNSSTLLSPSSYDDELTRLNNTHSEQDKKIVIAGLIVENTFTSILDMVFVIIDEFLKSRQQSDENADGDNAANKTMSDEEEENSMEDHAVLQGSGKMATFLRYLRVFLKYFITNNWNSASKVNEINLPSLYLSGLSDELIPPKQMKQLFKFAKSKSVLPVMQKYQEGDHNSTWQRAGQQYWDDIVAFITTTSFMAEQQNAN